MVAQNCREWESKNTPEIRKLWYQVFQFLDELEGDPDASASAAQVAADALELVLHCVDPALRDPDATPRVNREHLQDCLIRLSENMRSLEALAKKTLGV